MTHARNSQGNPFSPATREGLLARMEADGCRTFSDKLRWVEEHIPNVDNAAAFVGALVRGARKNPVKLQGGRESWNYAKAVADAYDAAPMYQRSAEPSYRALAASIEKIFKQILSRVDVQFVDGQPYADDKEMAQKVKKTGILYISKDFNEHPFFSPEQNLKFRAVHDWFSHLATGAEFSQRGELKAYNAQAKVTPKEALPALFTEVVGQASYATTYGDFPPQKVAILPGFDYVNVGWGEAAPPIRKQNPADPRYSVELGEGGAFTQAFAAPDPLAQFYTHERMPVDRGAHAVQTVTAKQVDAARDKWGDPDSVDASKILLLLARERLKNDKKALAYLPALEFVRVDVSNPRRPELIFTMPAYQPFENIAARTVPELPMQLARCLNQTAAGEGTIAEAAQRFSAAVRARSVPTLTREAAHVVKVLDTLHALASSLPLTKNRADLHWGNLAVDKDGHLILLDPMVAELKWTEAEKILKARTAGLKQNPPSPGFEPLGKGSRAVAYRKADEVEVAIGQRYGNYDLGKEITLRAWELADPEARKHLPHIRRLRVDREGFANVYYYAMPYYSSDDWTDEAADVVDALRDALRTSPAALTPEWLEHEDYEVVPPAAMRAVLALQQAARSMGAKVLANCGFDPSHDNFSVDKQGHVILRDVVAYEVPEQELAQSWTSTAGLKQNPSDELEGFDFFDSDIAGFGPQEYVPPAPGAVKGMKRGDQFTVGNSKRVYTVVNAYGDFSVIASRDDRKHQWFVVEQASHEEPLDARVGVFKQLSGSWESQGEVARGRVHRLGTE